jgi:hypothetical protein
VVLQHSDELLCFVPEPRASIRAKFVYVGSETYCAIGR